MIKKMKRVVATTLLLGMVGNAGLANATTTNGTTAGGSLGKTGVSCTISINGSSSTYSQAYLKIVTDNRVEKLGIKNINVVTKSGGGETGKKASQTNAYSSTFNGNTFAPGAIKSISAHFYVTSSNFGNFTKNMSY